MMADSPHDGASRHDGSPSLTLAANLCRAAGGRFWVKRLRGAGSLAYAELCVACVPPVGDSVQTDAKGIEAWLVGDPPRIHESSVRRILRLGWRARLFATVQETLAELNHVGADHAPALLTGAEPYGVGVRDIEALRKASPRDTNTLWLIDVEAPPQPSPAGRIGVHPMPLSRAMLLDLTATACRSPLRPLRGTRGQLRTPEGRLHVLVVVDNDVNRVLALEMLHTLGYEAETANDGVECVNRCLTRRPAAVLVDIDMPRMDGLAATRKLRQLQREGVIGVFPIIAVTGHTGELDRQACNEAGIDAMLPKPIDMCRLEEELAVSLGDYTDAAVGHRLA